MKLNNILIKNLFSSFSVDAILVTSLTNIQYLSRFSGSSAFILLTPKQFYFITDNRYKLQARQEVDKKFRIIIYQNKIVEQIQQLLQKHKIKKLGIENLISYSFLMNLNQNLKFGIIDCSSGLNSLRQSKSTEEVNLIKTALYLAEDAFQKIKPMIQPGIIEKDIAIELEYQMKKNGAEESSFPVIVASGKRSALPHASPTKEKIKNNSMVIIDFGAKYHGYNSDITYTINLDTKNVQLLKAYKIVQECLELAVDLIKPDVQVKDVNNQINQYIKANGFSEGMIHSLGHGIGREVHEAPSINSNQESAFQNNMVFTIEPGIYLEGIGGIRLEKTAYLNKNKLEILNRY